MKRVERNIRTCRRWKGSASKNSCATTTVNFPESGEMSSTAPYQFRFHPLGSQRGDSFLFWAERIASLLSTKQTSCVAEREAGKCERVCKDSRERIYRIRQDTTRTRSMSCISVPRPGPSSTTRMGRLFPECIHCERNQTPRSYPERCKLVTTGVRPHEARLSRTSPNTWLISGLVMKSPRAPMTDSEPFM